MDPVRVLATTKLSYAAAMTIPFGRVVEPVANEEKCVVFGGKESLADGSVAMSPEAEVSVALVNGIGGAKANEITIASGHTTGVAASLNISETDLSGEENINLVITPSIDLDAGDYQIGVSADPDLGGTPILMDLPEMEAGKTYYLSIPFAGLPADRVAVESVGLNVAVDKGASIVLLQHIRAGSEYHDFLGLLDSDVARENDEAQEFDACSILSSGLMRGQLAPGETVTSMQTLFPVPGTGMLTTAKVAAEGRKFKAAYPQGTAGGTVIVML